MIRSSLLLVCASFSLQGEPLINSWITELSGRYAQIYPDRDARDAQAPVTTWARGAGSQNSPTYAGVHEIAYDDSHVYIRTSNLGFHIMGPWYGDTGNLFPNYPANAAAIYCFPRTPNTSYSPKVQTGGGAIGYFVDGIAAYDSRDAFSYDTSAGQDQQPNTVGVIGDRVWNRDAYINESITFDPANAHQAGANHHYHANPPALRHLLGDSVSYEPSTHTYSENMTENPRHSPILGWVRDGLPIYGPYGYSDPTDASSPIRRMITGYQKRDGTHGSVDLSAISGTDSIGNPTGRTTLPQWVPRNEGGTTTLASTSFGPAVSTDIPIGHYIEDYAYKGDLTGYDFYQGVSIDGAYNESIHYDLNEYNVRFCVTPEYPNGTYAYFTNIEADGTPLYPYNLARYFFAEPTGSAPASIPAGVTVTWEGGPEKALEINGIDIEPTSDHVTLTWSSVAGGHYTLSGRATLESGNWQALAQSTATDASTQITDPTRAASEEKYFYRANLDYLEPFDDTGFDYDNSIISEGLKNNVLLLILDDWGIDSSELYNATSGASLARMPHLKSLLYSNTAATPSDTPDKGILFTRGYAQPICSPTRATLLTGRQPYQHRVGNPTTDNTLSAGELTFPEILSAQATDYGLASFGKWHLGSGNTGPLTTGGWPNFAGTLSGGVSDYADWDRVKIVNGVETSDSNSNIIDLVANGTYSSPYATSVQIDEAAAFIAAQGNEPWVVWMGFNAPHTPFHDPAPYVTPTAGYSTSGTSNSDLYIKMLEALDHEIGRLLASIDLSKTNVIVVGDNGTPGAVDQVPNGVLNGAKGSLGEGGIHVPFFISGPDVVWQGTSDKLVHVIDLFSTILDIAQVNVSTATAGIELHSRSLLPILQGSDMEDRCIISEKFGLDATTDGRSLIIDQWPQYKLVAIHDVTDPNDSPIYQMYEIGTTGVESVALTTPPNPGDLHEAAYNALLAKSQSLQPSTTVPSIITINIDLPSTAPSLINNNNGNIISPQNITIGGIMATWDTGTHPSGSSAARVDESGNPDQFSLVAQFDLTNSGLISGQAYDIIVTFPGGGGRDFIATNPYLVP